MPKKDLGEWSSFGASCRRYLGKIIVLLSDTQNIGRTLMSVLTLKADT